MITRTIMLLLMVGSSGATAQTAAWDSRQLGGTRYTTGTTPDGRPFTSTSRQLGGTNYSDTYSGDVKFQHCEERRLGGVWQTRCY